MIYIIIIGIAILATLIAGIYDISKKDVKHTH